MKRVIKFTKIRFLMFAVSAVLIIAGIVGTSMQGGLNFGIDFQSGLSQRIQIAPVAMEVSYAGEQEVRFNILNGRVSVDIFTTEGRTEKHSYLLSDYTSVQELADDLGEIPRLIVDVASPEADAGKILSLAYLVDLSEGIAVVNYSNEGSGDAADIEDIRSALSPIGEPQIQVVGDEEVQEYLIRLQDDGSKGFSETASAEVFRLLTEEYGSGSVIIKKSDYIGPRFSAALGKSVILLVSLAMALILMYIWFRFELAFAVSAIIALAHDVIILIGFIGITQMEVVTATVAAVLTIVGYSLNDTIVVFDRIRENRQLMRDSDIKTVVNTSISQSLSRTLITSLTTLLAVAAIYIFSTGQIKSFALAMIVGVIVGTYSSVFIASPVLLGWINSRRKRKLSKDNLRYGAAAEARTKLESPASEETEKGVDPKKEQKPIEIPTVERKKKGKRKKKK